MSRLSSDRVALAKEIVARYPVTRSALIPLIHLAQEQDGYVAEDAMEHIAELVGCTPAEVYGTGSFYEMFKFRPVGRYVIGVCTNISCLLQGGTELLEHAEETLEVRAGGTTDDGLITLEDVECIAACTEAPCLQVNYRYVPTVTFEAFDQLVADLRAGRLDGDVPPHGVLARVRQTVDPDRWAATGTAPPRTPAEYPGPALRAAEPTGTRPAPAGTTPDRADQADAGAAGKSPAGTSPARAPRRRARPRPAPEPERPPASEHGGSPGPAPAGPTPPASGGEPT